jgi:SAM-dependent methyltransferase
VSSLALAARLMPVRFNAAKRRGAAFRKEIDELIGMASAMDVAPPPSGYASYYDEKKEAIALSDPSGFLPKQKSVHETLVARRPGSVLDIGANTGWYSHLAANLGASVIALEEDESCVDILYGRARRQALKILPLKVSFGQLTTEISGAPGLGSLYEERGVERHPLYRAALERLGADLVLVLGLIHHLVLGEGRSIEEVFKLLAKFAKRTLVLEFVALDDEKILGDPGFFPNLRKYDESTYSLEKVLEAGRRHFATAAVRPSHPATRTILVFDR